MRGLKEQSYRIVAVFKGFYEGLWDLLELKKDHPISKMTGIQDVIENYYSILFQRGVIMIVNTEILEAYLTEKSLEGIKDHWIFNSIVEGQHLMEEPKDFDEHKLRDVYKLLVDKLKNFEPLNKCLWQQFFGDMQLPDTICVYLIVGSPDPYDAMVREDPESNNCIILDLIRVSSYSEDICKLSEIVSSFVTHEISHILTNNIYHYQAAEDSLFDNLKHIVFDEGIAHFLSFKENILSIDWYSDEMNIRRKNSYRTLYNALKNDSDVNKNQLLEKSNSGLFWEKFGAISGLFGIIDYYYLKGKDIKIFKYLFEKGPDLLIDFILNNKSLDS